MRMRKLSLGVIILLTSPCFADECQESLNACDAAYTSQKIAIKDLTMQVGNLADKNILQDRVISDQRSELSSPLRDPVKTGLLAAVVTIGVMVLTGHVQ